jgi:hypothetical protein
MQNGRKKMINSLNERPKNADSKNKGVVQSRRSLVILTIRLFFTPFFDSYIFDLTSLTYQGDRRPCGLLYSEAVTLGYILLKILSRRLTYDLSYELPNLMQNSIF